MLEVPIQAELFFHFMEVWKFLGQVFKFFLTGIDDFLSAILLHCRDDTDFTVFEMIAEKLGKIAFKVVEQCFLNRICQLNGNNGGFEFKLTLQDLVFGSLPFALFSIDVPRARQALGSNMLFGCNHRC